MAERRLTIVTVVDFGVEGLAAIEGSAMAADQRFDFVLNEKQREVQFAVNQPQEGALPVRYQFHAYHRDGWAVQRPSFESAPMTTEAAIFIVDPHALYRYVVARAVAVFNEDRYRHVFVDVKAQTDGGWSHTETIRVSPETPEGMVRFIVDVGAKVTLQQRFRYATRPGEVVELPWQPADEGTIIVGNPPPAGGEIG